MSVTIEPAEQLSFHGPFTRISKESLHVKNPGTEAIIFKVKTTAPKQYCVRPNAGRIEPNAEIEVQIILQPFKEELPEDFKCKDKFLVQTAPIHESFEQQDITSMWNYVETEEKANIHQHKIKCVFLGPKEGGSIEEVTTDDEKIVSPISEPAQNVEIASSAGVATTTTTTNITPAQAIVIPAPIHTSDTLYNNTSSNREIPAHQGSPITSTPVTATATPEPFSVPAPTPATAAETATVAATTAVLPNTLLINENKELKVKIKKLEQQLSELQKEEGLRGRNNKGRKLASTVQPLDAVHQHLAALEKPHPTEGYPPQVVMGVALLVFIITYLFF